MSDEAEFIDAVVALAESGEDAQQHLCELIRQLIVLLRVDEQQGKEQ